VSLGGLENERIQRIERSGRRGGRGRGGGGGVERRVVVVIVVGRRVVFPVVKATSRVLQEPIIRLIPMMPPLLPLLPLLLLLLILVLPAPLQELRLPVVPRRGGSDDENGPLVRVRRSSSNRLDSLAQSLRGDWLRRRGRRRRRRGRRRKKRKRERDGGV